MEIQGNSDLSKINGNEMKENEKTAYISLIFVPISTTIAILPYTDKMVL